jgi:hypothetical protein
MNCQFTPSSHSASVSKAKIPSSLRCSTLTRLILSIVKMLVGQAALRAAASCRSVSSSDAVVQ